MAPWPRAPVIPQLVDRKTFRDNRWSYHAPPKGGVPHSLRNAGVEVHFYLNGTVNTHNCYIWALKNPRIRSEFPLHSPLITVWCWVLGDVHP
ncbi:hypothetical protein TNCV_4360991 [Trichonephila clavipes]|nr:hypothetical protein TNCV_4360991 [Trichonephila clavipes]